MQAIKKALIMMVSLYPMQSISMDSEIEQNEIEVHPFMMSRVGEADLSPHALIEEEYANQRLWIVADSDDGVQYKASTRCGFGLIEYLRGNSKNGKGLIVAAVKEDHSSWALYYCGLILLIEQRKEDYLNVARKCFQVAHISNPTQIASHWYRHIMAMAGWPAERKDNLLTQIDSSLCKGHQVRMSYPLALCARDCHDSEAILMCLAVAAEHENTYQKKALDGLVGVCRPPRPVLRSEYAQKAEKIIRDIASRSYIHQAVLQLDKSMEKAEEDVVLSSFLYKKSKNYNVSS